MKTLAQQFAETKHFGQTRKASGLPYVSHPVAVMALLEMHSENEELMHIAALLHDTLEDTNTTFDEIQSLFGVKVANIVVELTSSETQIKEIGKLEYLKVKLCSISSRALTVKLADRLHNMKDFPTKKSIDETRNLMSHLQQNRKMNDVQLALFNSILEEL